MCVPPNAAQPRRESSPMGQSSRWYRHRPRRASSVGAAHVRPRPAAVAAIRAPAADPAAPLWRADSAPGAAGHGRGCVGAAARVGVLLQRPLQRLAAEALRLERRVEAGPGRVEEEAQVEPCVDTSRTCHGHVVDVLKRKRWWGPATHGTSATISSGSCIAAPSTTSPSMW